MSEISCAVSKFWAFLALSSLLESLSCISSVSAFPLIMSAALGRVFVCLADSARAVPARVLSVESARPDFIPALLGLSESLFLSAEFDR